MGHSPQETETLVKRIEDLAAPLAGDMGLDLVEVQFRPEGGRWVLRLFIDRPGGVTLDDCAALSRQVDERLEEDDLIDHAYTLEVSSPGLERPLKREADFVRFAGRRARIKLRPDPKRPGDRGGVLIGELLGFADGSVQLKVDDEHIAVRPERIAKARLTLD